MTPPNRQAAERRANLERTWDLVNRQDCRVLAEWIATAFHTPIDPENEAVARLTLILGDYVDEFWPEEKETLNGVFAAALHSRSERAEVREEAAQAASAENEV